MTLMIYTGLGPLDALTLPKAFFKDSAIATVRSKTGTPVYWRVIEPLKSILDAAQAHEAMTLCANSRGRPWTVSGFRASWRKVRVELENKDQVQSGLTLYGLRHTVATILREAGLDERTIADALGQKTEAIVRHYSRTANLKRKMIGVGTVFESEVNNRRTRTVKPG
ncbi:tyrosine-type recombinase/integrase [Roseibium sp. HPY-6]|uniref:tyrosine-type recombinase/integrase n=1 Tax=Roseibium sp. HPY-6 TaxID=3229852 RepID=UPI0033906B2B